MLHRYSINTDCILCREHHTDICALSAETLICVLLLTDIANLGNNLVLLVSCIRQKQYTPAVADCPHEQAVCEVHLIRVQCWMLNSKAAQRSSHMFSILAKQCHFIELCYHGQLLHTIFTNPHGTFKCPYPFIHSTYIHEFSVKQCLQTGNFCTG
jgi:hypothetical protein